MVARRDGIHPVSTGSGVMPSSALPLAYYLVAHAGFGAGWLVMAIDPSLPGTSFYQPRFVALVHLLTLAWLTGSILGSLYLVGPLALRAPMPVAAADWIAFGSFVLGTSGMVAHFWINTYDGMAWSAGLVTGAVVWVGGRMMRGLVRSNVQPAVRLHIALAFLNILAAAGFGMVIGFDRSRGFLSVSPLSAMFAHAHIAAVGWATMLVLGLSYRLIPMLLPAAMPTGRSLGLSAVLLQCGLAILTVQLVMESASRWLGALVIIAGVVSFTTRVRWMLAHRRTPAPALPKRDWSTWQVHLALAWLFVAAAIGLVLSVGVSRDAGLPMMWMYGVAGLVGFLAQMVAGMQGRLVPLLAWYRALAATGVPPERSAHALSATPFARPIFLCWAVGVPMLLWGLPHANEAVIRAGAMCLLAGVAAGCTSMIHTVALRCPHEAPHRGAVLHSADTSPRPVHSGALSAAPGRGIGLFH